MKIKFRGRYYTKEKKSYITLTRNHMMIIDALLEHGGSKTYVDSKNNPRFSEHFGLIDFAHAKVDKVIISGNTFREDKNDKEILLPNDMPDIIDYEYMFHTHPPTPHEGARAKDGVLYETPSVDDLLHFVYYYNQGLTQGSIVAAPEGIYVIRARVPKPIQKKPTAQTAAALDDEITGLQENAIKRYGTEFCKDTFYRKVAQDTHYFEAFNALVKEYFNDQIYVRYYPRIYDRKMHRYVYDKLRLEVEVIEPVAQGTRRKASKKRH